MIKVLLFFIIVWREKKKVHVYIYDKTFVSVAFSKPITTTRIISHDVGKCSITAINTYLVAYNPLQASAI